MIVLGDIARYVVVDRGQVARRRLGASYAIVLLWCIWPPADSTKGQRDNCCSLSATTTTNPSISPADDLLRSRSPDSVSAVLHPHRARCPSQPPTTLEPGVRPNLSHHLTRPRLPSTRWRCCGRTVRWHEQQPLSFLLEAGTTPELCGPTAVATGPVLVRPPLS